MLVLFDLAFFCFSFFSLSHKILHLTFFEIAETKICFWACGKTFMLRRIQGVLTFNSIMTGAVII